MTGSLDGIDAIGTVDFGRSEIVVRTRPASGRVSVRFLTVCLVLALLTLVTATIAIGVGEIRISFVDVVRALLVDDSGLFRMVVVEWRLPRAVAAILFGAALGLSGGVFQSLTRNPLGSPDIIGFDTGAFTGVLVGVLMLEISGTSQRSACALIGGIAVAMVVYLLAYRRGVQGFRLIIVGIGVGAMLGSINSYLLVRADDTTALQIGLWAAGSLVDIGWSQVVPAAIGIAAAGLLIGSQAHSLRELELGDEVAIAHGVATGRTRLICLLAGTACVAVVTATCGPISFVALAAPQLARRLVRSGSVALLPAALVGALLLTLADLVSLVLGVHAIGFPTGLVTVSLGGLYLIWLLIHEGRWRAALAASS
ncbi:MAG: iron chelate uptake ABC transporter family permease subunit [Nocardioides sp.]|uniref:FecCD family ABC transporter permease n=1 Tax=Nocardioides sp. TaxID=35761 RepID=UPI0039E46059